MTAVNMNISALTAQQGQRTSQMGLAMAMERLSTGQRINLAKDDAAGLAISQRMGPLAMPGAGLYRRASGWIGGRVVEGARLESV